MIVNFFVRKKHCFAYFFYNFIHGHSFLGLICFCIAGIFVCYNLIALIRHKDLLTAKIVRTVFSSVLCIGLLICLATEAVIVRASFGQPDRVCPYIVVLGAKVNGTAHSLSIADRIDATYD